MATYAQRKAEIRKALRNVKNKLNVVNAMLEKSRRESDRLLDRKTVITPDSLDTLTRHWEATGVAGKMVDSAMAVLFQIARQYL